MTVRRVGWLACLVMACLVMASCAARLDPKAPGASRTASRPGTPTTNRERTQVEAQRLLALAPLPPGRHPLTHAPAELSGPAMGAPVNTSLIDVARWWTVSMPFEEAADWIGAHPPAGLTDFGSSGTGAGASTRGYSYRDRDTQSWTFAQLEVSVAPAGPQSSYLRIDGVAEWLDPRPMKDSESGRRVHVNAATGCPSSDRGVVGVSNDGPGLGHSLLPPGRPTGALVCRYTGLEAPRSTLRGARVLSPAPAARVAAAARAVPLQHLDGEEIACPAGDASADVIAFTYAGRTVDLWYQPTGCPSVANGVITTGSTVPFAGAVRPWLS